MGELARRAGLPVRRLRRRDMPRLRRARLGRLGRAELQCALGEMRGLLHRILHSIVHHHSRKSTKAERTLRRTGSHTPSIHRTTPDFRQIDAATDAGSGRRPKAARLAPSRDGRTSTHRRGTTVRIATRPLARRLSASPSGEMASRPAAPPTIRLGASRERPASEGLRPRGQRPPAHRTRSHVGHAPSSRAHDHARAGFRGRLSWLLTRGSRGAPCLPGQQALTPRGRVTERWCQQGVSMIDAGDASTATLALAPEIAQHFLRLWRSAVRGVISRCPRGAFVSSFASDSASASSPPHAHEPRELARTRRGAAQNATRSPTPRGTTPDGAATAPGPTRRRAAAGPRGSSPFRSTRFLPIT